MNAHTLRLLEWEKITQKLSFHALSAGGKKRCFNIPFLTQQEAVQKALSATTEAKRILAIKGPLPVAYRPEMKDLFPLMEKGKELSPQELLLAADWIGDFIALRRYFSDLSPAYSQMTALSKRFADLTSVRTAISDAIELDGQIKDLASPVLSKIRREIRALQNRILEKLNQLMVSPTVSGAFQEPIITLRNDRYVVPIKAHAKGQVAGVVHDTSSSGSTLYLEPMMVLEMNNQIQELKGREKEEIERILKELTLMVLERQSEFMNNILLLEEIDFNFAKAGLSLELNGEEPILMGEARAELVAARHPLLVPNVTPIDIRIGTDFSVLVVTGPNTGGKTVALKTLGLSIVMAQCGLHPLVAQGSRIGVFQKIFCDIGDEQSLSQNLSTFSGHMKNIISILSEADKSSLVLLDEIGAGTDPAEGSALGQAIIEAFYAIGSKVVVTTHYDTLKQLAHQFPDIQNASVEFNEETLSPTYRLLIGQPGYSNALHIARCLGLEETLIRRAQELLGTERAALVAQREELEQLKRQLEKQQETLSFQQQEVSRMKDDLRKEQLLWQEKRQKLVSETRQELEKELAAAREIVNATIRSLQQNKSLAKAQEAKETLAIVSQTWHQLKVPPVQVSQEPVEFKIGEEYYVPHLEQRGKLLTLPDSSGEVQVLIGMMKTKVKASQLNSYQGEKPPKSLYMRKSAPIDSRRVPFQLDLRGLVVEDALRKLEGYLDEVSLSTLQSVSIIHGKGTGALQKAVHQYLASSPYVKEFRFGALGEGDYGVTIVILK